MNFLVVMLTAQTLALILACIFWAVSYNRAKLLQERARQDVEKRNALNELVGKLNRQVADLKQDLESSRKKLQVPVEVPSLTKQFTPPPVSSKHWQDPPRHSSGYPHSDSLNNPSNPLSPLHHGYMSDDTRGCTSSTDSSSYSSSSSDSSSCSSSSSSYD